MSFSRLTPLKGEQVALDKANRAFEKAKRLGGNPKEAYDKAYALATHTDEKTAGEKADLCLKLISLNVKGDKQDCVATLTKLLSNIEAKPEEDKFHKINLENEKIKQKIVAFNGGVTLLKTAGFEEGDEAMSLVWNKDLDTLKEVLERVKVFKV